MLKWFICPDNQRIEVADCLKEGGCRMSDRCATRSYLRLASKERPWTGKPSTTQLIQGTMCAFLKLTQDFATSPDDRAFMINGTKGHANLEASEDEWSILEQKFTESDISGIADDFEKELGKSVLADYKVSGSFKVAKALGFYTEDVPTGEIYKSGKRKGEPKTRKELRRDETKIDRFEWEMQLNKYRIEFEKLGFPVDRLKIQCLVRDGNTFVARNRGVLRNIYYFTINKLPDEIVLSYFSEKKKALEQALKQGFWNSPCSSTENWDGVKCADYCDVAEFCPLGKYLKKEKEEENMAIKGISEIRRLPRLGKIRLGIKKSKQGPKGLVEYPTEVDYFILDPQTPSELENQKLKDEFAKRYGEQPKQIPIMLPIGDTNVVFPQFYKRYDKSQLVRCKGDGVEAVCTSKEFAVGLDITGENEQGLPKVKCLGTNCPYYQKKWCNEVATLQVLLPEMPGAGVWQITTGSFHSIVNLNSCLDYVRVMAGRFHMIPLKIERRPQVVGQGTEARTHYILHINMAISLAELQKCANIDPTRIMLDLPEPEETMAELLLGEGAEVNPQDHPATQEPAKAAQPAQPTTPAIDDFYGNTERFNAGEQATAKIMIEKVKEYRTKLGDDKFLKCLGQEGREKVADFTTLKDLTKFVNALITESKNKEIV